MTRLIYNDDVKDTNEWRERADVMMLNEWTLHSVLYVHTHLIQVPPLFAAFHPTRYRFILSTARPWYHWKRWVGMYVHVHTYLSRDTYRLTDVWIKQQEISPWRSTWYVCTAHTSSKVPSAVEEGQKGRLPIPLDFRSSRGRPCWTCDPPAITFLSIKITDWMCDCPLQEGFGKITNKNVTKREFNPLSGIEALSVSIT